MVLTFVVDVSGSMDLDNRLGLVRRALRLLVDELRPTDEVGIVTYGDDARVVLSPTSVSDRGRIIEEIDGLVAGGSTFAEGGVRLGYRVADEAFRDDAANRVILLSDGVANVGETGPDALLDFVREQVDRGIALTTVGVGMDNFNDVLMERLANHGDGAYYYVDTDAEARRVFVDGLTGTLVTVAEEAKVQVEFASDTVRRYRLVGYVNRALADEDFRNDVVDAGEVGAGHQVTALYEVLLADGADPGGALATVRLRWADPATGEVRETERRVGVASTETALATTSSSLRLAATVAAFAEVLRSSPWIEGTTLATVADHTGALAADADENVAVQAADLDALVRRAASLAG